jgi:hypothetical protein
LQLVVLGGIAGVVFTQFVTVDHELAPMFWSIVTSKEGGFGGGVIFPIFAILASAWALLGLARLPGLLLLLRTLERTTPVSMILTVFQDPSMWGHCVTVATPDLSTRFDFVAPMLISPWWLRRPQNDANVLVYGAENGGPFLIQVPDGSVALIDSRPSFFGRV